MSRHDFEALLRPLLSPRVPDTAGNAAARDYISSLLAELGWDVALDTFTQDTAVGEVTFSNIVATRNAASPRRLVLAAHYDSKMTPEGFIGATDSAVPCAMLLHLARTMDSLLPAPDTDPELTLQLIFFDGEEAFISWTATDSLYGSRHLASAWATTEYTYSGSRWCQAAPASMIDRIDGFLLLDLLGAASPQLGRYTDFNTDIYDFAASVEAVVQLQTGGDTGPVFTKVDKPWMVQDDQVPFHEAGVRNILHMIPSPFPSVWHKLSDNFEALDMGTIEYLNKIVRVIVYGYLNS